MPASVVPGTIAAGESVSAPITLPAGKLLMRIRTPTAWTAANISFQLSPDNIVEYYDLCWPDGQEIVLACRPKCVIPFRYNEFCKDSFLKIRSGTSDEPIIQQAARTFYAVLL